MDLFVFLDESGNFDFSNNEGATRWYTLTSLTTTDPTEGLAAYYQLRHELYYSFSDTHHRFHATEDKQDVRNEFFKILRSLRSARIDCVAIDKPYLFPGYRPAEKFYPFVMRHLLEYVFNPKGFDVDRYDRVLVCADKPRMPKGQNHGLISSTKRYLKSRLKHGQYSMVFAPSESHPYLQFVDYASWSLWVKRTRDEVRPYQETKHMVRSDYDLFQRGTTKWY